jgi:hypothetical protein
VTTRRIQCRRRYRDLVRGRPDLLIAAVLYVGFACLVIVGEGAGPDDVVALVIVAVAIALAGRTYVRFQRDRTHR